jgi:hypothetical protein
MQIKSTLRFHFTPVRMAINNTHNSWVLVAHAYNPSYSGGRDQENSSLKPARADSLQDPISNNPVNNNWAGGVAQGENPEFKP